MARDPEGRLLLLAAPLALFPGEEVEAEVVWKARHGEGEVLTWLRQDPHRIAPGCPVAAACGGCELWGAEGQGAFLKEQMVEDLLHRQLQGIAWDWYPPPADARRHRIQLHWDGKTMGFHRKKSHQVVAIQHCLAAETCLSAAIPRLLEAIQARCLPTKPQRWELATGTPPGQVYAIAENGKAWTLEPDGWHGTQGAILHEFNGMALRHRAGGFFQVTAPWAVKAFITVLAKWDLRGQTLYDLFGGVGLFSALLGKRYQHRVLVEADPAAVEWATRNLEALSLPSECLAADIPEWMPQALGEKDDLILLDPPRTGLDPVLIGKLKEAGAGKLVLVGCDGAAFCRDIKRLCPEWELTELAVLDLFPLTSHAEFVGLLEKV